jgi:hypothetical protein
MAFVLMNVQYNDNVVGDGSNYNDAYFELKYVRTYTTAAPGAATGVAALGTHSGDSRSSQFRWSTLFAVLSSMVLGMII